MNVALSELPRFHRACPGSAAGRAPYRRHHHGTEPRLYGTGLSRRARSSAGRAASRSSRCSSPRPSTTASPRPAPTSRACSASTSRRSCPTAGWDARREEVADLMIAHGRPLCAPVSRARCVGRQVLTPLDLERDFGLDRRRHLSRRAHPRPALLGAPDARPCGLSRADRRPLLCGSGTHPGGGVTGAPGHNAAKVIAGDLRWRARGMSRSR